jgi:hypothetical protein
LELEADCSCSSESSKLEEVTGFSVSSFIGSESVVDAWTSSEVRGYSGSCSGWGSSRDEVGLVLFTASSLLDRASVSGSIFFTGFPLFLDLFFFLPPKRPNKAWVFEFSMAAFYKDSPTRSNTANNNKSFKLDLCIGNFSVENFFIFTTDMFG